MIKFINLLLSLFVFVACSNDSHKLKTITGDSDNGGLTLPEGFCALVVADSLGQARHIQVNDQGDIYVSLNQLKKGGGIACLRDTTNDGRADLIEYFGRHHGTGIAFWNNHLYFGSDTLVVRYPMVYSQLLPHDSEEIVVAGLPKNNQHGAKPLTFDKNGNLYVTVGAPSNACMEQTRTKGSPGMDPCPLLERHGGIWKFKADELGQDQMEDGERYATGIRHAVAIDWNGAENTLYALQHGRDQLHQFFPELYNEKQNAELPAEEFLLVEKGSDFGWPYCYYDQIKQQKVLGPEYGGDGNEVGACHAKDDPILAFPGHLAPNDLLFYTGDMFPEHYRNGAFIAFHGSWNRAPEVQEGYYVVFVPFEGKVPSGNWEIFADGFAGVDPVNSPRDAEYRPCGLAQGPDGSLFVTDDAKGRVWRIMYNPAI
ncbi:PQQ-dependent sugar dehydrogenase [uncultured Sunxiuqinia sp.]|uniref:PQQ-dependent sugar dehydrogenase n=1 Tax=uncultured Sunxiuqinia sp. TaxID=1573825 RepID=UPI0030DB7610